jgi:hypothetical protein
VQLFFLIDGGGKHGYRICGAMRRAMFSSSFVLGPAPFPGLH